MDLFKEIDHLKEELDQLRPIPTHMMENIREHLIVEWTYHSNSIEGNTLTIYETKAVIEDGIVISGKSLREHLEVINHRDAILFLEDLICNNEELSEQMIKDLHSFILRGINTKYAGVYRDKDVLIRGARHVPSSHLDVPREMKKMLEWYHASQGQMHPVQRASMLHNIFVGIHPFIDGNGRTARLLLNLELMKLGYVPIVIKNEQRFEYYAALDKSHVEKDDYDFTKLVAENLLERLELYIRFLK